MPYVQIGFIIVLYIKSLFSTDSCDFQCCVAVGPSLDLCLCGSCNLRLANVRKLAYLFHVFGQLTDHFALKTVA